MVTIVALPHACDLASSYEWMREQAPCSLHVPAGLPIGDGRIVVPWGWTPQIAANDENQRRNAEAGLP